MAVGRAESSIERTRLFELENEKHQENHDDDGVGDLSQERANNHLHSRHSVSNRMQSHGLCATQRRRPHLFFVAGLQVMTRQSTTNRTPSKPRLTRAHRNTTSTHA